MLNDNVAVALIQEALQAPSRSRRVAAGLILDMIRAKRSFDNLVQELERVRADEGLVVTLQMHRLVREHHLEGLPDAPAHLP